MNQTSVKDQILKLTDNGFNVYAKLINQQVKLGRPLYSPLRTERHPSFSIYIHRTRGDIWYKDFPEDGNAFHGDCFQFVQALYNLSDFKDVIKAIKQEVLNIYDDDQLSLDRLARKTSAPKQRVVESTEFFPVKRDFKSFDLDYFHRFLIPRSGLERFHLYPVKSFVKKKGMIEKEYFEEPGDPIYFIDFPSGNNKVYRPLTKNKYLKWMSNTSAEKDVFGLDQITSPVKDLFLLAGNKDTMSFNCTTGIPAIAMAAEGTNISMQLELKLSKLAERIHVLYDNDESGFKFAEKIRVAQGYPYYNDLLQGLNVNDYAQLVDEKRNMLGPFFKRLKYEMILNYK
jgi:hypothetical protein